jgi:hypothetical protein
VPIDFGWRGKKGMAFEAFSRWYKSPLFEDARKGMVTDDMLHSIMFKNKDPYSTVCSLVAHLSTKVRDRRSVAEEYDRVNGFPPDLGHAFDQFLAGLGRVAAGAREIDPVREVRIAFLEMVTRLALGNRVVDKILSRTGGGSPQGPGGTPTPSRGGTAGAAGSSRSEPAVKATSASSAQAKTAKQVRLEVVSQAKLPYSDVGLRDRLRAFVLNLTDNPEAWQKVARIHDTIMVNNESTFSDFFDGLKRRILVIGHNIDGQAQIDISFLEAVMRQALGNAFVDRVLKVIDMSRGGDNTSHLIRHWRAMIATKICNITRGPLQPVTPANRFIHLVMIFNPITGEPVAVEENASLPNADRLDDSTAAIGIDYVQRGLDTKIEVKFDKLVSNGSLSNVSRSIITSLKDTLAPLGNAPTSASGNNGAGSAGAPPNSSSTPPDASNASAMNAPRFGEPFGWRVHMAPPPAREIRGIVREPVGPTAEGDTVEIGLTDAEIAEAAAEYDRSVAAAATNTTITSAETFLMATAPVIHA